MPGHGRATMKDVASLAGVSIKTVSRVINDEGTVATDLAERVRAAASRLGYRHNLAASSLRRNDGKTATIGLLLEDVANPFSSAVHRAVEDVARARGVAVLAASIDENPADEERLAVTLVNRRVDGLIVVPTAPSQRHLDEERRAGLPVVFIDRPPTLAEGDVVLSPNLEGAAEGVAHLLAHGHRRIAYLGDLARIATARMRREGYEQALRRSGIEPDPALMVEGLHTADLAEAATAAILEAPDPPTAIFAGQNLITIGAIRALRARSLQHEIALVGFDEVVLGDLLDPALTVVAQDPAAIGRLAAELLFDRMDGDVEPFQRLEVPTVLVPRGSGELPPRR